MWRPLRCLPGLFTDVTSFDPLLPPCTAERAPVLTLVCQSAVTSHLTSRSLSERWDKLGVGVRGIRTTLGRLPEQGPTRRGPPGNFQFSCSVMSDSLRPPGPQHARLPRPSPTPGVYSDSCPWSRWCHLILWSPSSPALNLLVRGIHPPDPLAGLRLKQSIEPRRVLITFQRPQQSTLGARTDPTVLRPRVWAPSGAEDLGVLPAKNPREGQPKALSSPRPSGAWGRVLQSVASFPGRQRPTCTRSTTRKALTRKPLTLHYRISAEPRFSQAPPLPPTFPSRPRPFRQRRPRPVHVWALRRSLRYRAFASARSPGAWVPARPRPLGHGGPQEEGLGRPGRRGCPGGRSQADPHRRAHGRALQGSAEGPAGPGAGWVQGGREREIEGRSPGFFCLRGASVCRRRSSFPQRGSEPSLPICSRETETWVPGSPGPRFAWFWQFPCEYMLPLPGQHLSASSKVFFGFFFFAVVRKVDKCTPHSNIYGVLTRSRGLPS